MLKPRDQPEPPPSERPVGELIHELIEEGKAYAQAEAELLKAIAVSKARALILPAALFVTAFVLALAAVTALSVGVVIALSWYIGPLGAGFVGLVIFAALAGALGWYGARRLKSVL
ncbi:MAG TPA: phage holin family protein [Sphingomicrobium sp.]